MNRIAKLALYVLGCTLAAVAVLAIPACDAPLTSQETTDVAVLDQRIALASEDLSALEKQAKEQAKLLADQDPSNDAAAVTELEAIHARYMEIGQALQSDLDARGKILGEAADRVTQPVAGGLAAMLPAWSPLILAGGALASRLITKRSRDHLLDSFKALGKAQLGDFVGGLLKSLGYQHSNTDPVAVLGGAEVAAKKQGEADVAAEIAALKAKLEARNASPIPAAG